MDFQVKKEISFKLRPRSYICDGSFNNVYVDFRKEENEQQISVEL